MSARAIAHDCATYLYRLRGYDYGNTMPCECGRQFTLRPLTRWRVVVFWRGYDSAEGDVWLRNRRAERAGRREQTLRRREWNRG